MVDDVAGTRTWNRDSILPPLPSIPCSLDWRGPTPWSNWVIKGRVLAGAYPAARSDAETENILSKLLELGVNTFVCLQAEFSLTITEELWRQGRGLRPYVRDAQRLLIKARQGGNINISQTRLDLLHLPIIDGSVTSDTAISRLADDCCQRILDGERLYIHCWGGHGRTGTLVAIILARLYGLSTSQALEYTQAMHDVRRCPQGVGSPQTKIQVEQVKRILNAEMRQLRQVAQGRFRWPTVPLSAEPVSFLSASQEGLRNLELSQCQPQAAIQDAHQATGKRCSTPRSTSCLLDKSIRASNPFLRSESLIPAGIMEMLSIVQSSDSEDSDELAVRGEALMQQPDDRQAIINIEARPEIDKPKSS